MPQPKDLTAYSDEFFTITRAIRDGLQFDLEFATKGQAINFRQRFYTFRQKLMEQAPALAGERLVQAQVTLQGTRLTFGTTAAPAIKAQLERIAAMQAPTAQAATSVVPRAAMVHAPAQVEFDPAEPPEATPSAFDEALAALGFSARD